MSILFVLLTFLLILSVMYFRRPGEAPAVQAANSERTAPHILQQDGFELPLGYCFHPGHTWLAEENDQTACVGMDAFAANLIGEADSIALTPLNRWVRQGQKFCTVTRDGKSIELLSPVEGVLISVNHEVLKDPKLATTDPYQTGWLCKIKAPDLKLNKANTIRGPVVPAWMQNNMARLGQMMQELTPALAQDGGVPIKGLLFHVEPDLRRQLTQEFFLT